MSGRASKQKGSRREREMVARLRTIPGISPNRVPLSGACQGFKGDLLFFVNALGATLEAEVKARANASGWQTIKKWLGDSDALFLIEDYQDPLVVLPWSVFETIMKRLDGCGDNWEVVDAALEEIDRDECE